MLAIARRRLWTPGQNSPRIDLADCQLYAPLGRPDQAGSPFTSKPPVPQVLTVTGATWGSQGRTFDGDDYITVPDAPSFNITTTLSVLAWAAVDDITYAALESIVSKYLTTTPNREWRLDKNASTGQLTVYFGDPADGTFEGSIVTDNAILSNGVFVQVGFTFNAGTVLIYANGVSVPHTVSGGAIPVSLFNGTSDVKIGAIGDNSATWRGKIREGLIFNRVLTPSEIQRNYQATK